MIQAYPHDSTDVIASLELDAPLGLLQVRDPETQNTYRRSARSASRGGGRSDVSGDENVYPVRTLSASRRQAGSSGTKPTSDHNMKSHSELPSRSDESDFESGVLADLRKVKKKTGGKETPIVSVRCRRIMTYQTTYGILSSGITDRSLVKKLTMQLSIYRRRTLLSPTIPPVPEKRLV